MPCFHPLARLSDGRFTSYDITFHGRHDGVQVLPCGRCVGCRLERSRQWATRIMHEAQMHPRNSFVTLSYDDAHLPDGATLVLKHQQDFLKRLRRRLPDPVRFFRLWRIRR